MMQSTAELVSVDPARSVRDEASILESWATLNQALEDGRMSEGQAAYVLDREPPDDADPLVRNLWARQLRRWAHEPGGISANADALVTYPCRCADGYGWIYTVDDAGLTWAVPCPDCNARQRMLWLDCWSQGGDHTCPNCRPRGGKTPTPLAGGTDRAETARAEADAASQRTLADLT